MFARTAVTGAQNAGRMERLHEAQDLGIKVKKKWLATLDSRTRDSHADLDGQEVDVDQKFKVVVDGHTMEIDYPGDPTAPPELVYNCRCTLTYVYPKYQGQGQRRAYNDPDSRESEVISSRTYREWKQQNELSLSDNGGIIESEGRSWRNNELHYSREERKRLVKLGVDAPEPVFSRDTKKNRFPSLAKKAAPDPDHPGLLDIITHGSETTVDLFGEPIDGYILSNIMMTRHDHKPGQGFRLLSCETGMTETTGDCIAQILANQTGEFVVAPRDKLYALQDGTLVVKGFEKNPREGWREFYSRGKE